MPNKERYVVAGARSRGTLELHYIVTELEQAHRTAIGIEQQERLLGNRTYTCVVIKECDYDCGKRRGLPRPKRLACERRRTALEHRQDRSDDHKLLKFDAVVTAGLERQVASHAPASHSVGGAGAGVSAGAGPGAAVAAGSASRVAHAADVKPLPSVVAQCAPRAAERRPALRNELDL